MSQEGDNGNSSGLTGLVSGDTAGIEFLPSCFASSDDLLERVLAGLDGFNLHHEICGSYLRAFADSLDASECYYINSKKDCYLSDGTKLAAREARGITGTFGFLFKRRHLLRLKQAISPFAENTLYIPLGSHSEIGDAEQDSDAEDISGIVLSGTDPEIAVNDSFQTVVSALYELSDGFSKKVHAQVLRLGVYDRLKQTYGRVSDAVYERRWLAFQDKLDSVDLHFEPIVEFSHSSKRFNIFSFEALARIEGRLPRSLFAVAELWGIQFQTALDKQILRKSLNKYLGLLEKNQSRSYSDILPLSVNVYPSTILSEDYRSELYRLLEELGFPGHKLVLEISEKDEIYSTGSQTKDLEAFLRAKEELKKKRVKIAIDDFGTGNSSLLRVQKVMPDYVKIDRQILLYQPKVAKEIINQLLNIRDDSHNRMFSLIVEGLDEEVNLNISISELVNEMEVDYIQGHLLAEATDDTPQRLDREKYLEIQKYLGWAS